MRYQNKAYGFSFDVPAGWELNPSPDPMGKGAGRDQEVMVHCTSNRRSTIHLAVGPFGSGERELYSSNVRAVRLPEYLRSEWRRKIRSVDVGKPWKDTTNVVDIFYEIPHLLSLFGIWRKFGRKVSVVKEQIEFGFTCYGDYDKALEEIRESFSFGPAIA